MKQEDVIKKVKASNVGELRLNITPKKQKDGARLASVYFVNDTGLFLIREVYRDKNEKTKSVIEKEYSSIEEGLNKHFIEGRSLGDCVKEIPEVYFYG